MEDRTSTASRRSVKSYRATDSRNWILTREREKWHQRRGGRGGRGEAAANFHEKSTVPHAPIYAPAFTLIRGPALKASAKINIASTRWPFNQTGYRNRGLLSSLLFFPPLLLLPLILLPARRARIILSTCTRDVGLFKIEIYVRLLDGTVDRTREREKVKVKSAWKMMLVNGLRTRNRGWYLKHPIFNCWVAGVYDPRKIRVGKIEDARGVVEACGSSIRRNEPVSSEQNELINPPGTRPYAPLDNYSRKCAHTCTRQVSIPRQPPGQPESWTRGSIRPIAVDASSLRRKRNTMKFENLIIDLIIKFTRL